MTTACKISRNDILWGFAGPPYAGFNFWMGDQLINKLNFCIRFGFKSTSISLSEIDDPERRDQILPLIKDNNLQMTTHFSVKFMTEDKEAEKRKIDVFLESPRFPVCSVLSGPIHQKRTDTIQKFPDSVRTADPFAQIWVPALSGAAAVSFGASRPEEQMHEPQKYLFYATGCLKTAAFFDRNRFPESPVD